MIATHGFFCRHQMRIGMLIAALVLLAGTAASRAEQSTEGGGQRGGGELFGGVRCTDGRQMGRGG